MTKKDLRIIQGATFIDETALFEQVSAIIENRKRRAKTHVSQEVTLMFWEVGHYVDSAVLNNQRAACGKKILTTLSAKLSRSHIIEQLPLKEVRLI